MDASSLRKLTRAELQKVARANNIKANLKSETIISLLLERWVTSATPPRSKSKSPTKKLTIRIAGGAHGGRSSPRSRSRGHAAEGHSNSDEPTVPTPIVTSNTRFSRANDDGLGVVAKSSIINTLLSIVAVHTRSRSPTVDERGENQELGLTPHSPLSTNTTQESLNTPPSSPEPEPNGPCTRVPIPAPPKDLEDTVSIIAAISTSTRDALTQITSLREATAGLRKRAEGARVVLRAERGRRERLEAYLHYWTPVAPKWELSAVWGDKIRLGLAANGRLRELDSDEESDVGAAPGTLATLKPGEGTPPHYEQAKQEAEDAIRKEQKRGAKYLKRPREEEDSPNEDAGRYKPRSRPATLDAAPDPALSVLHIDRYSTDITPPLGTSNLNGSQDVHRVDLSQPNAQKNSMMRKRPMEEEGGPGEDAMRYQRRFRRSTTGPASAPASPVRVNKGKGKMTEAQAEALYGKKSEAADQFLVDTAEKLGMTDEDLEQHCVVELLSRLDNESQENVIGVEGTLNGGFSKQTASVEEVRAARKGKGKGREATRKTKDVAPATRVLRNVLPSAWQALRATSRRPQRL